MSRTLAFDPRSDCAEADGAMPARTATPRTMAEREEKCFTEAPATTERAVCDRRGRTPAATGFERTTIERDRRQEFGELAPPSVHAGLPGLVERDDLVLVHRAGLHPGRSLRHAGDSQPYDVLGPLGNEPVDQIRGHMPFDHVAAGYDRGVTRAEGVGDAVFLLVDVDVGHIVSGDLVAGGLEVLHPLLAAPARGALIDGRLLGGRKREQARSACDTEGHAPGGDAQPFAARNHRSSERECVPGA